MDLSEKEFFEEIENRKLMIPEIIDASSIDLENSDKEANIHSSSRICIICGIEFSYGSTRLKICGCCKIKFQCPECGKIQEYRINRQFLNKRKVPEIVNLVENDQLSSFFNFCDICCAQKFRGSLPYMRKSRSESNIRYRKEYPEEAIKQFDLCREKNIEWRINNPEEVKEKAMIGIRSMLKWQSENPEENLNQKKAAVSQMHKYWKDNPELSLKVHRKSIQKANDYWESHPEEKERVTKEIFDRRIKAFYNKHLDFKFRSLDKIIDLNHLFKFKHIPGVWSIWGTNKENNKKCCLTVGQTMNLYKEIYWALKVLYNEKLQYQEDANPGCTGRWNLIQKDYHSHEIILICDDEHDKMKREVIEAIYAKEQNALYWKPSISQAFRN